VTVPHKQSIIPHVDVLTDAAKEIGSVNTVIVKKDKFGRRVLIGDNMDWWGIYNPLMRRVGNDGDNTDWRGIHNPLKCRIGY
jgi:pentafunctional AROM polypeptide